MAEQVFIDIAGIRNALGKRLYDLLGVDDGAFIDDNPILNDAIESTNSFINDHLRKRYALPLIRIPSSLTDAGYAICGHKIIQRTRPDIASDREREIFQDGIDYLDKVSKGIIELQAPPENQFERLGESVAVGIGSSQPASSAATSQSWFRDW